MSKKMGKSISVTGDLTKKHKIPIGKLEKIIFFENVWSSEGKGNKIKFILIKQYTSKCFSR